MNDAAARHLKPGGVLIPGRLEQMIAPVTAPRCRNELIAWDSIGRGLDFGPARVMSLNNAYVRKFPPAELLDRGRTAVTWDTLDFKVRNRFARKGTAEWRIAEPVTVHGLAVWWAAELVPGVTLSTSPLAAPTHWEQLFLPALEPLELKAGETLVAQVRSRSSEEGAPTSPGDCGPVPPKQGAPRAGSQSRKGLSALTDLFSLADGRRTRREPTRMVMQWRARALSLY